MADGPDGIPVLRLSAYGGKRVDDMTREELVEALNGIWRAYCAVNAAKMNGTDPLGPMPEHDVEALEAQLATWFYGPGATAL